MKPTISKNKRTHRVLEILIQEGYYIGSIESDGFELFPNRFPCNFRILGKDNYTNEYEINFDFVEHIRIASKYAIRVGILICIIFYKYWLLTIPCFIITSITSYAFFKLEERKQINLFIDRYLKYYEKEKKRTEQH